MDEAYTHPPIPGHEPLFPGEPTPYGRPQRFPRLPSDRRDVTAAVLLAILSVVAVNFSLYGHFGIGYAIGYLSLLLCGGIYLRGKLCRRSPFCLFCLSAAVAASGLYIWHDDATVHALGAAAISVLIALALLEATGLANRDSGTVAVLQDVWRLLVRRPLAHMKTAVSAIFLTQKGETVEKRRCGGALLGLLCALPVLLVVVPLLIAADAAFEGLLQHTVLDNLGEAILSLGLGIPLFCLLYSRLFGLRHALPDAPTLSAGGQKTVSAMGINAFLGTIGGVYVLYLVSQLAYFLSAFSGILPEGYTVAQYARRGFFEMTAICTINLLLVALCLWLSRKQEGKAPLSTRLLCLFVLVFSLGLVATALSKMGLYIHSFGMTRLRILTAVFMLMLAAVLVFVGVRLFAERFPYMKATVIAVAVLGLAMGYADVDTVIARYNVTAHENGTLQELDIGTLQELGDGAVPYLVALWDSRTPETEQQLARPLYERLLEIGSFASDEGDTDFSAEPWDFRSFTVDRSRARRLLCERAEEIRTARFAHSGFTGEEDRDYDEIW